MNEELQAPGPLMLDLRGLMPEPDELELLQRESVGGVILFARNYDSPGQLRELTAAIRQCAPHLLIAVDQEGGRVQRFREGFTALPPLRAIGEIHAEAPERGLALARDCGFVMAAEIIDAGLDFSFAPVLDLYDAQSPVIGERAFSADPQTVATLARAYVAGMADAGMAAVGKHFPGHGMVGADSHVESPVDSRCERELRTSDMQAFVACHDSLAAIMPAHVIYSAACPNPAGFSRYWLQTVLREQIGFRGVIFSDDLNMAAAHAAGCAEQRAEQALAAGCDMLLLCNSPEQALQVADSLDKARAPRNRALAAMRARSAPASARETLREKAAVVASLAAAGAASR